MKTSQGILMIEPTKREISSVPIIDELTRKMTAAWRNREDSSYAFRGIHECACGAWSDNKEHWVGPNRLLTNSLCIHYLAFHREEVPLEELEKVRALNSGEAEPNEKELTVNQRVNSR